MLHKVLGRIVAAVGSAGANPHDAPTGLCLPLAEIEALLRQDPDRLVVVDEAYVDFGGESAACLLGRYDNLLVVGTFSKSRPNALRSPSTVSEKSFLSTCHSRPSGAV